MGGCVGFKHGLGLTPPFREPKAGRAALGPWSVYWLSYPTFCYEFNYAQNTLILYIYVMDSITCSVYDDLCIFIEMFADVPE
jgi:hypothetical protein